MAPMLQIDYLTALGEIVPCDVYDIYLMPDNDVKYPRVDRTYFLVTSNDDSLFRWVLASHSSIREDIVSNTPATTRRKLQI
jgi:hypothetical protein